MDKMKTEGGSRFSRRDFLRVASIGALAAAASGCGRVIESFQDNPPSTQTSEFAPAMGSSEISSLQESSQLAELFKTSLESSEFKPFADKIYENSIPFSIKFPTLNASIEMVGTKSLPLKDSEGKTVEIPPQLWVRKAETMISLVPVQAGETGKEQDSIIWVEPDVVVDGNPLTPAQSAEAGYGVVFANLKEDLGFRPPSWVRESNSLTIDSRDFAFITVPFSQSLTPIAPGTPRETATPTVGDIYEITFRSGPAASVETLPEGPLPDDLEIVTDLSDPEKIPVLDFEAINSEFFINKLIDMDRRGLLPQIPDTSVTVSKEKPVYFRFNDSDGNFNLNEGRDRLYSLDPTTPTDLKRRSWALVGVWNTNYPDYPEKSAIIVVYKWKNFNNTYAFVGYFYGPGPKRNMEASIADVKSAISKTNGVYPDGLYFSKTSQRDGCSDYQNKWFGDASFCPWYYKNPEVTVAPEIFGRWEKTGILSNIIDENTDHPRNLLPIVPLFFNSPAF